MDERIAGREAELEHGRSEVHTHLSPIGGISLGSFRQSISSARSPPARAPVYHVRETQIPGAGDRFVVTFDDDRQLTIIIRNEGERQVRWRSEADANSELLFELSEREARRLAEIFDGSYFESVDTDLENALEDADIEWVEVDDEAPVVGQTLRESGIRTRTGVSVIAVQRSDRTHSNPDSSFRIEAGDVLVVVGSKAEHEAFEAFLS
ncbi:potassium transporter TrkA [Salinigranum rubrum]|uniref:Potassium transporter TrkA n=1 Tax=Salinigranum rubrum TaxID=755307 RepID=A0A2I8VND8_9EURY|nr:potassium transporter TrkA [Salinigranum rubrum]